MFFLPNKITLTGSKDQDVDTFGEGGETIQPITQGKRDHSARDCQERDSSGVRIER